MHQKHWLLVIGNTGDLENSLEAGVLNFQVGGGTSNLMQELLSLQDFVWVFRVLIMFHAQVRTKVDQTEHSRGKKEHICVVCNNHTPLRRVEQAD